MGMYISDAERLNRARVFTKGHKPELTKEELRKKFQREFLDDDRDILERLDSGEELHQRYIAPFATWLSLDGRPNNPNVTAAVFRRFRDDGYIEEISDDKETHSAVWTISEYGQTVLDKLNGVVYPTSTLEDVPDPYAHLDSVPEAHIPEEKAVVALEGGKGTIIRTKADGYMLLIEFGDYATVLKVAALLKLDVVVPQSEVVLTTVGPASPVTLEELGTYGMSFCDFCHKHFEGVASRGSYWMRHCGENECKKAYGRTRYAFIKEHGRPATASDRNV